MPRKDNGPEFISQLLRQFCLDWLGISYIPPETALNNGHNETFNNRLRRGSFKLDYWASLLDARLMVENFKDDNSIGIAFLARIPHLRRWPSR
ncbi:hypothetical protein CH278_01205 [Rhodococcus sp. 05-2254-5]|nr:hypothetical protein CH278_01205 [Rhodococcus sp. 05-2254-5]OZE58898.1 hypothetical protein CH269_07700 [Rhodococcus sp. 05-2254-1]